MVEVITNSKEAISGVRKGNKTPYNCNITTIRTALGMSRSELARIIGTTNNFLCMCEHNKYYPPLSKRIKIAKALNTDTSALWIPIQSIDKTKKEVGVDTLTPTLTSENKIGGGE